MLANKCVSSMCVCVASFMLYRQDSCLSVLTICNTSSRQFKKNDTSLLVTLTVVYFLAPKQGGSRNNLERKMLNMPKK